MSRESLAVWLEIVQGALRPQRPLLESCRRGYDLHRTARRVASEERRGVLAGCEARIEAERRAVMLAADGVISMRMRELEREWLRLSRADVDGELMDLWARIAPASWLDQKRWRDSATSKQVDAAIALASDPEGVEAAEAAVATLRDALAPWGVMLPLRVRWSAVEQDVSPLRSLLGEPLRRAEEAVAQHEARVIIHRRASALEQAVHAAAGERFPDRPLFAADLAHAAWVDALLEAARIDLPSPMCALQKLLRTGYAVTTVDASAVTVEIPAL